MADQAAHRNAEVSAANRVVASAQVGTSPDAQYGPSVVARRILSLAHSRFRFP